MALVYSRAWFATVFALLAVALVAYLASRLRRPVKWGSFLTHLGLLIVVLGGFLSWTFAVRGTLSIEEGASESLFELDDLRLSARLGSQRTSTSISWALIDEDLASDVDAEVALADGRYRIAADRYLPHPQEVTPRFVEQGDGFDNPAIEMDILRGDRSGRLTLFANDPERWKDSFDGLHVEFTFVADQRQYEAAWKALTSCAATSSVAAPKRSAERLLVTIRGQPDQTFQLQPGNAKVGLTRDLAGGQGYVKVLQYVPDFEMGRDMQARTRSDLPNNPAIQVEVQFGSETSTVWLFGKMSAFHSPSLPSEISVDYQFETRDSASVDSGQGSVLILAAPGKPFTIIRGSALLGETRVGDTIAVAEQPPTQLSIEKFWGNAALRYDVVEGTRQGKETEACVRVSIRDASGKALHQEWAPLDKPVRLATPDGNLELLLERPKMPLGFEVFLDKFEAPTYPGSMMPSAYISTVTVNDPRRPAGFAYSIYPNNQLVLGGYKLYQSAYDQTDDGKFISILGVSKDPGAPAFYIGSVCLMVGLLLRFYIRGKHGSKRTT